MSENLWFSDVFTKYRDGKLTQNGLMDMKENFSLFPLDTGNKSNVHKTFRRCPGRLLTVLCTFNLRLVSKGFIHK